MKNLTLPNNNDNNSPVSNSNVLTIYYNIDIKLKDLFKYLFPLSFF